MPDRKIRELINFIRTDYTKYSKTFTVTEIVKILKKLSDVYYNTEENLVPDVVYDDLKELLEKKDFENPFLSEVGAPIKGTKEKVKLPFGMGSLTKIKPETGDLEKWEKKYKGPFIISDKLDGVSAQLYKDKKGNTFLYTRGNGTEGQDISHLIPYFVDKDILNDLEKETSVRGELIMSKANFEKVSSYMKNSRNAVAGLVNSKTVDAKIAKLTEFITYSVLSPKMKQSKQIKTLEDYGFKVVTNTKMTKMTNDKLKEYLMKRKEKTDYEMDGIVCVDDSGVYEQTDAYPDHAFAFKMMLDNQVAIAEVVEVEWNVSKNWLIKPRVKIVPVDLTGTTVTYATGHNAKFISDSKLGPGAKIKIVRSGDVIPYILEIIKGAKTAQMPSFKYKWNETEVDIIADKNDKTAAKTVNLKLLVHFFSTMGVKYLAEGILSKFVDTGIDSVAKILKAKPKDFKDIEGLGDKSIKKIYDEISRAFNEVELPIFMYASHEFGRGMGSRVLEDVLAIHPQILMETNTEKELFEKIQKVPNFAEKRAKLFVENFMNFKKFYEEIGKIIDLTRFEIINTDNLDSDSDNDSEDKLFAKQKIVFTQVRDTDIEKFIKKNGGQVMSDVSSNTTILIHKDGADISKGKLQKASKIKTILLISLSEFKKKYNI